jgi:hypothetical protein
MTKLTYANTQVDNLLSQIDSTMTITTELLKDQDFSLDDRWDLYLKIEKLLPVESYLGRAINVLSDRVSDNFFPDGKGCRYNSQIDESILESHEYFLQQKAAASEAGTDFVLDEYDASSLEMYAKRDAWREAVLAEGQGLVVFDW